MFSTQKILTSMTKRKSKGVTIQFHWVTLSWYPANGYKQNEKPRQRQIPCRFQISWLDLDLSLPHLRLAIIHHEKYLSEILFPIRDLAGQFQRKSTIAPPNPSKRGQFLIELDYQHQPQYYMHKDIVLVLIIAALYAPRPFRYTPSPGSRKLPRKCRTTGGAKDTGSSPVLDNFFLCQL